MNLGNFDNVSFDPNLGGFDCDFITDYHDGTGEPWHQRTYRDEKDEIEARISEYREQRTRLRADIVAAIDGPAPQPVLEALAEHAAEDGPAEAGESLDFGALLADMATLRALAAFALREARLRDEEDDEDVTALILH